MSTLLPALLALIGGGLLSLLVARVFGVVFGRLTRRTRSDTDDFIVQVIVETIPILGWVVSASWAWWLVPTPPELDRVVFTIAKLILVVFLVRLVNRISLRLLQRSAVHSGDPAVGSMLRALAPMLRALVWSVGAVLYLQNIGVQMAAIWALLSAGGIGAGLALKQPVSEFFEYITILLDKPFQTGQFINVGEVWGTVERVGVRTTRLRSVNGEAIVMSNSALTSSVVANYGEMQERRLIYRLGVTYDTSHAVLERIPGLLKAIVERGGDTRFDRAHFVAFNSSSLDFELVYFVPSNNYIQAMEAQQRINLDIVQRFAQEGIEFAFPTQTLHVHNALETGV
ncbi:mechanosensitive ion channel family protein [Synechococcus sp. LTW-R]|uniref:mechanosensitive ion channel family protein n=1 Tax=Synechococcus sp. LTW-R TaxID=2751170 RepID=UPI001624C141|nr:mechanosensitive ion channel family protein [Synechococcus sp. LTW-R]QNG30267.1 mechanosensitive ion channel family protein [Synechococcus sp. LTW-R]